MQHATHLIVVAILQRTFLLAGHAMVAFSTMRDILAFPKWEQGLQKQRLTFEQMQVLLGLGTVPFIPSSHNAGHLDTNCMQAAGVEASSLPVWGNLAFSLPGGNIKAYLHQLPSGE
jgi:hypothetical protein